MLIAGALMVPFVDGVHASGSTTSGALNGVHRLHGPLAGRFQAGRSRDARPVDVGQHVKRPHDLRVLLFLRTDARRDRRVGVSVRVLSRRERSEKTGDGNGEDKSSVHGGSS